MKLEYDLNELENMLKEEYNDLDTFLNETEEHYKRLRDSHNQSSLKFITDQTSNLATIRGNKVNIIKELINVEKLKIESQIKEHNLNKGEDGSDSVTKKVAAEVYNILKGKEKSVNLSKLFDQAMNEGDSEQDKQNQANEEDLLAQRMEAINKKKEEKAKKEAEKKKQEESASYGSEEVVEETVEQEFCLAADVYGNIYALDLDMQEILDDIDVSKYHVTLNETEDGSYVALLDDGTEIPLIDIVEEE